MPSPRPDPHHPAPYPLFAAAGPSGPLPTYHFRRGDTLYFKRKVPADVAWGFPESKGQVWKSDLAPEKRTPC